VSADRLLNTTLALGRLGNAILRYPGKPARDDSSRLLGLQAFTTVFQGRILIDWRAALAPEQAQVSVKAQARVHHVFKLAHLARAKRATIPDA